MAKLYIFAIGGTGSRVLKSLTMLLASGVKINADTIVPIIIDPDKDAGDLTRTVEMMKKYNRIHSKITFDTTQKNEFFRTGIDLTHERLYIEKTEDQSFSEYIGYSGLDKSNKAFTSMLFSKKNLNAHMDVGFKGNPNIGSVVLNQFQNSETFRKIIGGMNPEDSIFVISSIFGGTGASGFPLLVKNLRAIQNVQNQGNARNAHIGAITILPYFTVKPNDDSEIDSSTFIAKTKAALTYYKDNVNEPNALYYLADKLSLTKPYNNAEGGQLQQNDAHIIELLAALAIIDFTMIPNDDLHTNDGQPENVIYKEYGAKDYKKSEGQKEIIDAANPIIFENLYDQTNKLIRKPLTQFVLFNKFMAEHMEKSIKSQPWARDLKFDEFLDEPESIYPTLTEFREDLYAWLTELARNSRGFAPFEIKNNEDELFSFVKGITPAKVLSLNSNYDLFDSRLNSEAKSLVTRKEDLKNQTFVELFFRTTQRLAEEKLKMK